MEKGLFDFYKAALSGELTSPLCADYKNEWRTCGDDKERLICLAMRQQSIPYVVSHAYKGFGLDKEYIKREFGEYINGHVLKDCDNVEGYTYQLWVDVKSEEPIALSSDVTSLMYCDDVSVLIPQTKCNTIYVSNRSSVHFTLDGFNSVQIYMFDESNVVIEDCDDTCSVLVYKYNSRANVELGKYCMGKVKIFNKTLRL